MADVTSVLVTPEQSSRSSAGRPPVAVVVPFHGDREEAEATARGLLALSLGPADEVILVDNTADGRVGDLSLEPVRVVSAPLQQSSYHARNVGALACSAPWVLFTDADCRPRPDLIDRFFDEPIPDDCGAIAGSVLGAPRQAGLVPEFSRSREVLDQEAHFRHNFLPFANTSNLLVRREVYDAIGGFLEGIRSGGDADFCWRLQQRGWTLGFRRAAVVEHLHRESVRGMVRQFMRYGAGHSWLDRRHPGSFPPHRVPRKIARALLGTVALTVLAKWKRARMRTLDVTHYVCLGLGYRFFGNASAPSAPLSVDAASSAEPLDIALLVTQYPQLSESFVSAEARTLQRLGHHVRVIARRRGDRPEPTGCHGLRVSWYEDDHRLGKLRALVWLALHAPRAALADRSLVARYAHEERHVPPIQELAPVARRLRASGVRHLHAHFADGCALDAVRLGALLGVPYSVTAHAYDIYQQPRNLEAKLRMAAFVTSGCDYTVRDLRRLAGPEHANKVHRIVMGIDPDAFRREGDAPHGRTVVAIGRLVEKKGFADLLDAVAEPDGSAVERLVIAGDGPLRQDLAEQVERLGLDGRVELLGARRPHQIRELLESADVLAMPCRIAADGDRDSMPVVVKEAMAMELPVVVTDEVGLPELVDDTCGRLVPPGDSAALAGALREVLELAPEQRRALGVAGRRRASELCDVRVETEKLAQLIAAAGE